MYRKTVTPVAESKICYWLLFGRFANNFLPLLWHHAQILLWLSLMIVWVFLLTHRMWCRPCPLLSHPKQCFQRSSPWAFLFFLFPSNALLTRRASASLLCWSHGCSIWSLWSVAAPAKHSLTAAWFHDPKQFFLFLFSLKPKTLQAVVEFSEEQPSKHVNVVSPLNTKGSIESSSQENSSRRRHTWTECGAHSHRISKSS